MRANDRLYRRLLGGLYHSTSVAGWRSIRQRGEIVPNDGSFPFSHGQSKASYCYDIGGISLLDLRSPSRPLVGPESLSQWRTVLTNHRPLTILLQIEERCLTDKYLFDPDRVRSSAHAGLVFVPVAEACFVRPIPIEAIRRAYVICPDKHTLFQSVTVELLTDERLVHLGCVFEAQIKKLRQPRHNNGGALSLSILVNQCAVEITPTTDAQREE